MANQVSLSGFTVLVVEDDFHLATCTHHALREAGAEVLGPVAQEAQALALIESRLPSCAIIDVNLGEGARFTIADALKARGVPFMFMTGYDDVMIPERFNDIGRMRKPSGFRLVVQAAAQMCRERLGCQSSQADADEHMAVSSISDHVSSERTTLTLTSTSSVPLMDRHGIARGSVQSTAEWQGLGTSRLPHG